MQLALAIGLEPALVLRMAGKARMADLLDRAYPERGRPSQAESEAVEKFRERWRRASAEQQEAALVFLRADSSQGTGRRRHIDS